jgi:5'-nucleotidase (lipoprotein e(P4) family)
VACAPQTTTAPAPAPAGTPTPGTPAYEPPSAENAALRHREVHWFRTAAEYRALAEQVYGHASEAVREAARGRTPGSWAVIMDADETVLDNSEFERRIAESGDVFEEEMWSEWVREEAAGLIPGSARFIDRVHELGGRVAIVTNRDDALCPATIRNLTELGIQPAVVLCETETSQKEARFRMVQEGTAASDLPPLEVVMWIGDNIGDFPELEQSLRSAPVEAFGLFGERYFVLPNPMYGSWMGNDWR